MSRRAIRRSKRLPSVAFQREATHGIAALSAIVHRRQAKGGLEFIFRALPEADAGVDGLIEVISDHDEYTGNLVAVQVKCGESYLRRSGAGDIRSISVRIRASTVEYWQSYAVPVLLVVVDPSTASAYWVRVDGLRSPEQGTVIRVDVPVVNRLEASARETIAAIASEKMVSLKELLYPSTLAPLQAEIASLRSKAVTDHQEGDWAALAGAQRRLAERLLSLGRRRPGFHALAESARAYACANDGDASRSLIQRCLDGALAELHDSEFALDLWNESAREDLNRPATATNWRNWQQTPPNLEIFALLLEATALDGDPGAIEALIRPSHSAPWHGWAAALAGPRGHGYGPCLLSFAEAVLSWGRDEYEDAALLMDQAGELAPDRFRARFRVGAAAIGLLGRDVALADRLVEKAEVSDPAGTGTRMVCGLRAFVRSEFSEALRIYDEVRRAELAANSPITAYAATRCLEWCARSFPNTMLQNMHILGSLAPLESTAESAEGEGTGVPKLLKRAKADVRGGRLAGAYSNVRRAALRAVLDADVAALGEAATLRGQVWCRASIDKPSDLEIAKDAIRSLLGCRPVLGSAESLDLVQEWAERLVTTLPQAAVSGLVEFACECALMRGSVGSAMQLLVTLGAAGAGQPANRALGALIDACLGVGWAGGASDSAMVGCIRLFERVSEYGWTVGLTDAQLNTLSDMVSTAPTPYQAAALTALAIGIHGSQPAEGVLARARAALSVMEHSGARMRNREVLLASVAATSGATAESARVELLKDAEAGDWSALGLLVWSGGGAPKELMNRYANGLAERLERLLSQGVTNQYGFGYADVPAATSAAAVEVDAVARDRLAVAAQRFLVAGPHIEGERAVWMRVCAQFGARASTSVRVRCHKALLLVAQSGVPHTQGVAQFSDHPLAMVRADFGSTGRIRAAAFSWLPEFFGWLATADAASASAETAAGLLDAMAALDPSIRAAGLRAAAQFALTAGMNVESVDAIKRCIGELRKDPSPEVRIVAAEVLTP